MSETSDALAGAERALRQLMVFAYGQANGPDWLTTVAPAQKITSWRKMMAADLAKRAGQGFAPSLANELDFSTIGELIEVMTKNWASLEPALGPQADMEPLLRRVHQLRNSNAHSREPLPYQRDLVKGISGEIRARVTTYMSQQAPSGEYYPRIEMARDSFGNELDTTTMTVLGYHAFVRTEQTLRPGDVVQFDCRGTDPQGRLLYWTLRINSVMRDDAEGDDVTLTWEVWAQEVAAESVMEIEMTTHDQFTRMGAGTRLDGHAAFVYEIVPPAR